MWDVIVPLCSAIVRPYLQYGVQVHFPPPHPPKKDMDVLKWVWRRAVKMSRGLEHLSYEELNDL